MGRVPRFRIIMKPFEYVRMRCTSLQSIRLTPVSLVRTMPCWSIWNSYVRFPRCSSTKCVAADSVLFRRK